MNYHYAKLKNGISKGLGEITPDVQDNSYDEIKQKSEIAEQIHNIRCFMVTFDKEIDKYKNGNVDNKSDAAISMKYAVVIINDVIADMDPAALTKEQLMEIHDIEKKMKETENFVNTELPEAVLKDFENKRNNRWPF